MLAQSKNFAYLCIKIKRSGRNTRRMVKWTIVVCQEVRILTEHERLLVHEMNYLTPWKDKDFFSKFFRLGIAQVKNFAYLCIKIKTFPNH